LTILSSLHM